MVKYTYDAWGNHTVEDNTDCNLGTLNPFRYRGYYYDAETGLYYLQTRYYDPEIGRFVTIDDVAYLAPDTVGGLNLYAYCNNNPVMGVDPTGHAAISRWISDLFTKVTAPLKKIYQDLKSDFKAVINKNTSEKVVLDSNYFSFYNGTLVIHVPWTAAGMSFGVIFLGTKRIDESKDQYNRTIEVLKHEYGHRLQLKEMGFFRYAWEVALPSFTIFWLQKVGKLQYDYNTYPWEADANKRGGSEIYKYDISDLPSFPGLLEGEKITFFDLWKDFFR